MSPSRRVAAVATATALAFGCVTLLALEGGRVAVLETAQPDGSLRRTRVWFAEHDGAIWIESATAERPFYRDLERRPQARMMLRQSCVGTFGEPLRLRADLVAEPGGHELIRELLARHYGWADGWIGLLQDTSGSRAVRLVPETARAAAGH